MSASECSIRSPRHCATKASISIWFWPPLRYKERPTSIRTRLIPFTSARRFYFAAAAASRDSALGLAAARHFAMAKFQVLEYLAASCTHLEAALDTLVKNERVLSDANAIHIERRSEGILVRVEPLTAGWHHCWVEFAVGAIYLAGRRIPRDPTAAKWRPIPWFAYAAPAYATEYEVFFGTRVRFNAPASGLLIPSAALQERLESADTRLREVLDVHSKDLAIRGTSKASLVERAQALVRKSLPDGDPGMDAIATRLTSVQAHFGVGSVKRA